jgi:hypothetical protein
MAKDKDSGPFYIELQRDLGYRGAHLGKGFIMDASDDRDWAEYLCLTPTDAKKLDKLPEGVTAASLEKPWENPTPSAPAAGAAEKHPTAPRAHGDAPKGR